MMLFLSYVLGEGYGTILSFVETIHLLIYYLK